MGVILVAQLERVHFERDRELVDSRLEGKQSGHGPGGRTREQLYNDARKLGIEGRSTMSKKQLQRAVAGDGMELIQQIVTISQNYDFDTQVLTASVRHPVHFVQAALIGSHVATVPLKVIKQLLKHPLTDVGLAQFLADAKKIPTGK